MRVLLLVTLALALVAPCVRAADSAPLPPPPPRGDAITAQDFAKSFEHLLPALQHLWDAAQEAANGGTPAVPAQATAGADAAQAGGGAAPAGGRRLHQVTAAATLSLYDLRRQSRINLLASDAFGMVYSGGNFARAIFMLMQPMVAAGQTGVITVDATYILNITSLLAQVMANFGDLMSKGARLTADGILPI